MTIIHPSDVMKTDAFVFAELGGFTCSICAPNTMTKLDVERFAEVNVEGAIGGWESVDVRRMGAKGSTPHPCQHDANRTHWFLLDGLRAAAFGFPTKK